ncbi:MAG: cyclic nucleotide-binding domain-containing protein [Treponema sp.]|jgi:diguanylate cyclase (GGDEF)-like protein|nr:cyclic nucleotide-binding domain-containing protein [Treponema sp.]
MDKIFPQEAIDRQSLNVGCIETADLFAALSERDRKFMSAHAGIMRLRQGDRLFSGDEKAEHFYMLLEGKIRIIQTRPDGKEDETACFVPGDTIGDFDFIRRAAYNARAEAVEDSCLVMFPGSGFRMDDLASEDPRAVSRLLINSILMMNSRIKQNRKFIVENLPGMQELRRRSYEDPGTGLLKQAFLDDELNSILEDPTTLFMMKPDRFKILVDTRGHTAGDEAMVRIAAVLKNAARRRGVGWPLRFKSNETGLVLPRMDGVRAEEAARELAGTIAALDPVPAQNGHPAFNFSVTVSWAVWPGDEPDWETLFQNNYALLLSTWRAGGNRIIRYGSAEPGNV